MLKALIYHNLIQMHSLCTPFRLSVVIDITQCFDQLFAPLQNGVSMKTRRK